MASSWFRRVATAGFNAVAVDLLSRQGGAGKLNDPAEYSAALSKQDPMVMVSDLQQALSALSGSGRGLVSLERPRRGYSGQGLVKAAMPFYGPPPKNLVGLATTEAAVLAVYAEQDTRITSTKDVIAQ